VEFTYGQGYCAEVSENVSVRIGESAGLGIIDAGSVPVKVTVTSLPSSQCAMTPAEQKNLPIKWMPEENGYVTLNDYQWHAFPIPSRYCVSATPSIGVASRTENGYYYMHSVHGNRQVKIVYLKVGERIDDFTCG
jgi:hypothetical protein